MLHSAICLAHPRRFATGLLTVVAALLIVSGHTHPLFADDSTEEAPKVVKLDGVFVADQMTEITTNADKLGALKIERLVAHGKFVKKGENVVWLETSDTDEKIGNAEVELQLAQLTLENAEFEFKQFLEIQKLDRKQIERDRQQAQQSYDNFVKVDRQRQIDQAKFNLESAEAALENVQEELNQLQQMYEEDDLTEESEEIVLKRARQAVEAAEFRLVGTKTQTERLINQSIPQQTAEQDDAISKARVTHQTAVEKQKNDRLRKELELSKQRKATIKQAQEFETMREQRKQIILTSPHDGLVIHGELASGKIADKESPLQVGSSVTDSQVIATIVNPNSLHVLAALPESDFSHVTVADEVTVMPGMDDDVKITGKVKSISRLPVTGTKFEMVISIPRLKDSIVLPATSCSVELPVCTGDDAETKQPHADKINADSKDEDSKKDGK
jgi:multidrug resistance efflux pump